MHPELQHLIAVERVRDVARHAGPVTEPAVAPRSETIVIRPLRPRDVPAISRLAELEERVVPPGPLLVAEVDGTVEAAVPLAGGETLASPFGASAEVVVLLELRAEQLLRAA